MKNKILTTLLIIGVITIIAIGATRAFFNDVETSTNNTFTAGNLNLQVGDDDPTTWKLTASNIKPGDKGGDKVLLQNTGSIDGYLHITFANLINDENGCAEPEGLPEGTDVTCDNPGTNQGELLEKLDILIYLDKNNNDVFDLGTDALLYQGKTKGLLQGDLFNYFLGTGGSVLFKVEWNLDISAGNIVQSDKTGFDVNFELTQNKNEDIVGDWHFDENSGTISYDNSGFGNNGTINGATWVNGRYNYALSFDGIDDYTQVSHSTSLNINNDEITLEAWVKLNALPPSGDRWQILGKADAYALQIANSGGGKARVWLGPLTDYVQTDAPEISVDTWYHLVGVYNGSSVKIYIDGNLKKEVLKTGNQAASANSLIIGARLPGGYFNGTIDEARVYAKALTGAEILQRYLIGQ